jgi:hypothetical protein
MEFFQTVESSIHLLEEIMDRPAELMYSDQQKNLNLAIEGLKLASSKLYEAQKEKMNISGFMIR